MAQGHSHTGYTQRLENTRLLRWSRIELRQTHSYGGDRFVGEIYRLQNKTRRTVRFHESQFVWQPGVMAVALEKSDVKSGESIGVYLVRAVPS